MKKIPSWKRLFIVMSTLALVLLVANITLALHIYKGFTAQLSPTDGVWHCPELGLRVSFETDEKSYVKTADGETQCLISFHRQSPQLRVFVAEDLAIGDETIVQCNGELLFSFKYIKVEKEQFLVKDDHGNEFTFRKVEDH